MRTEGRVNAIRALRDARWRVIERFRKDFNAIQAQIEVLERVGK